MFSSPVKSFVLPVYTKAMAHASPPTRPTCVSHQRNVDPRILEFFDITATIDVSFPVDSSDSGSTSLSRGISKHMSSMMFAFVLPVGLVSFLY
jgi:hypothetical protein